MNLKLQFILR